MSLGMSFDASSSVPLSAYYLKIAMLSTTAPVSCLIASCHDNYGQTL